jgi:hypothetical protein
MKSWFARGMLASTIALPALSAAAWGGGIDDFGCLNATLKGDYAFSVLTVAEENVGPNVVVGLGTFDGRGGFTQIDYPGNGATDMNLDEKFRTGQTGSYKVNRNCTGFMTINIVQAGLVIENAIVISNGGRAIHGVVASGTVNGAPATPLQTRVDFWRVASEQDN